MPIELWVLYRPQHREWLLREVTSEGYWPTKRTDLHLTVLVFYLTFFDNQEVLLAKVMDVKVVLDL